MSETASTGKKIGMSRIDRRIAWLGEVFLAYEQEMLRRGAEKVENSAEAAEHRPSRDDMFLTGNLD